MVFETPEVVAEAVRILRRGGIVVTPTRTNYNIVCDPESETAIGRVFEVKRRTKFGPLTLFLTSPEQADRYVTYTGGLDQSILRRLWPGELSFILPLEFPFPPRLTMGGKTIAITNQGECTLDRLSRGFGGPLGMTSANLSGQGDIFVDREKAFEDVGKDVDLFIAVEEPSPAVLHPSPNKSNTIVDLTFEVPYLVRPGIFPLEPLRELFPRLVEDPDAYKARLSERLARERAAADTPA
jgi:L-threonylcarbamoyladenylate synthase